MDERFCKVGDVELCYETFGESGNPPLLLVNGLGTQMIAWPHELCAELVALGFFVIRFDNRDVGRSTHFRDARAPTAEELAATDKSVAAYTLSDMADDAFGLLDVLGIEAAHLAGVSMGGMISQVMAASRPERVLSLTSIMSSTGRRDVGQASPAAIGALITKPPDDREGFAEYAVGIANVLGSPGFDRDDEEARLLGGISFDRCHDPHGVGRQLAAIFASGNRTADVERITAPTVVVHGTDDPLIDISGGRATAEAIKGSKLIEVEGMGHDLPRGIWPILTGAIAEAASRAGAPIATSA